MAFSRGNDGASSAYHRFYAYDEKPKAFALRDFSGGVSTRDTDTHALSAAMNMLADGRAIRSFSLPREETTESILASGAVSSHCYAQGIWLFRKGRSLYAYINGSIALVGTMDMLTEERGAIYFLDGVFYVIDGEHIFTVDGALQVTKLEQRIPICFVDWMNDGITRTENEKPNPFCRYIDLVISEEAGDYQALPVDIAYDPEDLKIFYRDSDQEVEVGRYAIIDQAYINFIGVSAKGCRIRLRLLDSDDETKLSFSKTAHMRAFFSEGKSLLPHTDAEKNAYFLTWDGNDVVLISYASDMFFRLSEAMLTRLPTEKSITAITSYADGFLLFTEDAVKKLWFAKNELEEIILQTHALKQDFGSDMAGSVCCFDDKIVFASSRGGIFYINRFGITERDESCKISENIEHGEFGFFSHTAEEYQNARGICAFGRYYLTVGEVTYIWDYRAKLPSATKSRQAEAAMVWTLADGFSQTNFLREVFGRLYLWDMKTEKLRYLTDDVDEKCMVSMLMTSSQDMGVLGKKTLTEISIRYRADAPLSVRLIFDGLESAAQYTLPMNPNSATATLRVYAKRFEKVACRIFCEGGFTLEAILFQYL